MLSGASEGEAGGLKGARGDVAEELDGIGRGGGSRRLGGSISDEDDLELANEGNLGLGQRRRHKEEWTSRVGQWFFP